MVGCIGIKMLEGDFRKTIFPIYRLNTSPMRSAFLSEMLEGFTCTRVNLCRWKKWPRIIVFWPVLDFTGTVKTSLGHHLLMKVKMRELRSC